MLRPKPVLFFAIFFYISLACSLSGVPGTTASTLAPTIAEAPLQVLLPTSGRIATATVTKLLPTATPTLTPTNSPTPSASASPTLKPTSTESPTLVPLGDLRLVFVATPDGEEMPAVYAINPDGTGLTRLTQVNVPEMVAGRTQFFLSPDGKRVAFYAYDYPNKLYAMNVDGSQLSVIKEASQGSSDDKNYLWRARHDDCKIAWSPDGTQLAFMSSDQENWALQVETFNLSNGKMSVYTWPDLYYDPFACHSINWSPDGMFLAFNASLDEGPDISSSDGRLIKLSLADGKVEFLSDVMGIIFMSPASWSPDGKVIVYSHADGTIVLVTGQSSTIKKFDQYMAAPAWSPSGSFLLSKCQSGLCRFESDGEVLTPIDVKGVSHYTSSWVLSPDERLIAYLDDQTGGLYLLPSDGSEKEVLLVENVLSHPIWQTSAQAALPSGIIQPPPTITPTPLPTLPAVSTVKTRVALVDGMVQVYVPAGEFLMGSDQTFTLYGIEMEDHMPEHLVYLDAYWTDQTEVTNAQYKLCFDAGACTPLVDDTMLNEPYFAAMPVTLVERGQAITYCQWAGRQLPTEAQWEKAARGTDGRRYPWGNQEPDSTLIDLWGGVDVVGRFPAGVSPYGVFDMQGNAEEWLVDIHTEDYYGLSPYKNPPGPTLPADEMFPCYGVRGDAVLRTCYEENMHASSIGFRCVQTP
ncbi:MAG: SUMF1/EgtB/PvdO family nonheme iron enzyme [Chloroflexota bacterium]